MGTTNITGPTADEDFNGTNKIVSEIQLTGPGELGDEEGPGIGGFGGDYAVRTGLAIESTSVLHVTIDPQGGVTVRLDGEILAFACNQSSQNGAPPVGDTTYLGGSGIGQGGGGGAAASSSGPGNDASGVTGGIGTGTGSGGDLFQPGTSPGGGGGGGTGTPQLGGYGQVLFIWSVPVPPSPTAGVLSAISHDSTTATLSWTAASGGVGSISAQLQISAHSAGIWSDVSGQTASPGTAAGLTASTAYDFRVAFTDTTPTTVYSNSVTITTDATPPPPSSTAAGGLTLKMAMNKK